MRRDDPVESNLPPRTALWFALVAVVAVFALGVTQQSRLPINHDVGWIVHSAGVLLAGGEFGRDIVDPSPPSAWLISLPAAWLHGLGVGGEVTVALAYFWLLAAAAQALVLCVLWSCHRRAGAAEFVVLAVATAAAAFFMPAGILGQRDVIATAYAVPYLLLVAARLDGPVAMSRWLAALVGAGAGMGFCLKPYLLAVPALVEIYRLARSRDLMGCFRPETLAMVGVILLCLLAILWLTPGYVELALPLIQATYWAYQESYYWVSRRYLAAIEPAVLALGMALATRSFGALHAVLIAALAGASASYWLQYKAFSYHAYPVSAIALVLIAYATVHAIRAAKFHLASVHPALRFWVAAALLYLAYVGLSAPLAGARATYKELAWDGEGRGHETALLVRRLRELGAGRGTTLFAISTHPRPGFPTANYLDATWVGNAATQFAIPAYVRRSEIADPERIRAIEAAAMEQRRAVANVVARSAPEFVLIEGASRRLGLGYRKFDDLAFYLAEPAFRQAWSCYRLADTVARVRIFMRLPEGCAPGPAG